MTINDLQRIAEAADDGGREWEWQGGYPQKIVRTGDVVVVADCFESPDAPARFAEYIATFDPPTVLWLLALADALYRVSNGTHNTGANGYQSAREFARAALDRHTNHTTTGGTP